MLALRRQLLARLRQRPGRQLLRDPAVLPGRDPHRPRVQAEQVDRVELEALHLARLGDHHGPGRRRIDLVGGHVAGLGHRGDMADEVADRPARDPAREVRRKLGQPREVDQPLGRLGRRGEQAVTAHPDPLDQPPDEHVRAHRLHRVRRGTLELEESLDPVAGLRPELRALERRVERRDHVQLAPPGDRRHARQVGGAQVNRRPRQGPNDGRGVVRVREHPQPGQRVTDLRALKERGVAGHAKRDAPLLERGGDQATLAPSGCGDHADPLWQGLAGGQQVLDLARRRLGLGPFPLSAPEADRAGVARRLHLGRRIDLGQHGQCLGQRSAGSHRSLECHLLGVGPECPEPGGGALGRTPEAPDRLMRVERGRDAGVLARERRDQAGMGGSGVLQLVDQQVRGTQVQLAGDVGAVGDQPRRLQHQVARVEASRVTQDAVVARVELGELDLAPRPFALGRALRLLVARCGPVAQPLGADQLELQQVDAPQETGQEPGRIAADLVPAERQVVDAVEQDREPVGGRDRGEERIEPGLDRVLAQHLFGDLLVGADSQLLMGRRQLGVHAPAEQLRRGPRAGEDDDPVGGRSRVRERREPAHQSLRAARPRRPGDQQRSILHPRLR